MSAPAPHIEEPAGEPPRTAPSPFSIASERDDRKWGRALALGLAAAVVLHVAILLSVRSTRVPPAPFSAAGPRMGDVRAAGGGSGMEAVEVRVRTAQPAAEPEPVIPTPVPVPERVVVRPEIRPVEVPDEAPPIGAPSLPGTGGPGEGGEQGQAAGPGTATGTGRGGGGSAEEGQSGLIAPSPRGMILPPPDRPRSARGQEITVWVFVSERGRVVPDSTRLDPPTPDRKYNERLKRSAAEWVFEPARRAGRAVAAWYPYQIIL